MFGRHLRALSKCVCVFVLVDEVLTGKTWGVAKERKPQEVTVTGSLWLEGSVRGCCPPTAAAALFSRGPKETESTPLHQSSTLFRGTLHMTSYDCSLAWLGDDDVSS